MNNFGTNSDAPTTADAMRTLGVNHDKKNAEHQFQIWQHEPGRSLSMQDARTRRLGMHNLWYCAITWPRAATKETSKNLTNKWSSHPVALNKMIIIARKSRVILKLYTSLRRTDLSAAQGVQL